MSTIVASIGLKGLEKYRVQVDVQFFRVLNEAPLSSCLGFAVYNLQTKKKVEEMLKNADLSLPVAVRPQFYFKRR